MKSATNIKPKSSVLLNKEENEQVFKLLGPNCQTLATTVIQLFATDGPESTQWIKQDVGILCFVRDTNDRSYFFRLYCLVRNEMVWEHEIYNNMRYLAPRPFLHTFEAEERIVAFNFANEDEAAVLKNIVLKKLKFKAKKRLDRKNRENSIPNSQVIGETPARAASVLPPESKVSKDYLPSKKKSSKSTGSGKKCDKKSITKDDIGQPTDFVHVTRVWFDKDVGFKMDNIENIDDTMWQFFKRAGITLNDLKDEETAEYIYDFIERNGGYDAVKQEQIIQQSTPTPNSLPPPPLPRRNIRTPYSASSTLVQTAPPPAPLPSLPNKKRVKPPPPSGPPPSNVHQLKNEAPSKPARAKNAPSPPPPPPAPPAFPVEEPIVSETASSNRSADQNTAPDPRSELMKAIRSGSKGLKPVETETKKPEEVDSRGKLMDEIRHGLDLKPVPKVSKPANNTLVCDNLASALRRALLERNDLMHTDSSSTDATDDSENEWDD